MKFSIIRQFVQDEKCYIRWYDYDRVLNLLLTPQNIRIYEARKPKQYIYLNRDNYVNYIFTLLYFQWGHLKCHDEIQLSSAVITFAFSTLSLYLNANVCIFNHISWFLCIILNFNSVGIAVIFNFHPKTMEFLAFISNFNNWLDIDMFKEHIIFFKKNIGT